MNAPTVYPYRQPIRRERRRLPVPASLALQHACARLLQRRGSLHAGCSAAVTRLSGRGGRGRLRRRRPSRVQLLSRPFTEHDVGAHEVLRLRARQRRAAVQHVVVEAQHAASERLHHHGRLELAVEEGGGAASVGVDIVQVDHEGPPAGPTALVVHVVRVAVRVELVTRLRVPAEPHAGVHAARNQRRRRRRLLALLLATAVPLALVIHEVAGTGWQQQLQPLPQQRCELVAVHHHPRVAAVRRVVHLRKRLVAASLRVVDQRAALLWAEEAQQPHRLAPWCVKRYV
mmetsp:Transcript_9785/g.34360  ORF Transcript_9785/g.34360 Transcript_9785/m.34360 type:complete len:287 (-) Transcript_9785:257-1117(-)